MRLTPTCNSPKRIPCDMSPPIGDETSKFTLQERSIRCSESRIFQGFDPRWKASGCLSMNTPHYSNVWAASCYDATSLMQISEVHCHVTQFSAGSSLAVSRLLLLLRGRLKSCQSLAQRQPIVALQNGSKILLSTNVCSGKAAGATGSAGLGSPPMRNGCSSF